jgi:hypothetical protein
MTMDYEFGRMCKGTAVTYSRNDYTSIRRGGLRKRTKHLSQDSRPLGYAEYESAALTS